MTASPRVLVVGAGRSGRSAARLARARGARVTLWDERNEPPADAGWDTGSGPLTDAVVAAADRIVVSPGIDVATHPVLGPAARAPGGDARLVGEIGYAAEGLTIPVVGITGTNGKSTLTHFVGTLLSAALPGRTFVGGNLGDPLADAVREGGWDRAVVELSSYQLERAAPLRPVASVILNLTPDHLARHGTMDGYAQAKWRILAQAGPEDLCVVPPDHPHLAPHDPGVGRRAWLGALPGVVRDGRSATLQLPGREPVTLSLDGVQTPGDHNLDHAATAALLALAMGAPLGAIQDALPTLTALPHRMQPVHTEHGVVWIDDSKATNVEATSVAVSGLDRPAVVLLGGEAKGPGFAVLAPALRRHRAVVTFGASGPAIAAELRGAGVSVAEVGRLRDAVVWARAHAQPGDAVLLSPGCASFDAFHDFAHRGRMFTAWARGEEGR